MFFIIFNFSLYVYIVCTYYRNLYKQFWSLLPGFCTLPTDGKSEFGNIAKVLGLTLKNNEEVRLVICQSLDVLISRHLELSKNKKASEVLFIF
eukprot:Pgem_evm1s8762